jgi:hypothetical protein
VPVQCPCLAAGVAEYWIPAFAGMTAVQTQRPYARERDRAGGYGAVETETARTRNGKA